MKREFGKYLPIVIPSLFSLATLNPEMGISGVSEGGDIVDVLNEVKPTEGKDHEKHANVVTDEIEEKDVAI
jgi:hypothetical protein